MALVLPAPLRRLLPARLVEPVRRLVWRLPNLQRNLPSGLRVIVESPPDWTIYNDIFAEREYDVALEKALEDAPRDRPLRVLDLGANVGYFVLRLADLALRPPLVPFEIVAVEASPALVRELRRRILGQPQLAERVRIVGGLAGSRGGQADLYESSLHFEHSSSPLPRAHRVPVDRIDLADCVRDWPEVDLLKCDIEGSELELVETYARDLLPRVRRAVFELHHARCDTDRCLALLESAGLRYEATLREAHGCSVVLLSRNGGA